MKFIAICHTCQHQHAIDFDPVRGPGASFSDWMTKHPGPIHDIDFEWPGRTGKAQQSRNKKRWEHYIHNANVKVAYAASAQVTITLASLAASSTLLAGRESTAVDNTSNLYLDYLIGAHYKTATTNIQAGIIQTAVVGWENDVPTWPDVFDGTDSTETVTVQAMYDQICRVVSSIATDATARTWPFGPVAIAGLWGGLVPGKFVVFVSHNAETSTNAWDSTEGNHKIYVTGAYQTVS